VRRYQQFIQTLNNIPKVCILPNMLMDGLTRGRAGEMLDAEGAVRSLGSLPARRPAATHAFHRSMFGADARPRSAVPRPLRRSLHGPESRVGFRI
jgi:hypothetical protein